MLASLEKKKKFKYPSCWLKKKLLVFMLVEKKTFGFHVGFILDEKKNSSILLLDEKKNFWFSCWRDQSEK
jgi:hypothetical protein